MIFSVKNFYLTVLPFGIDQGELLIIYLSNYNTLQADIRALWFIQTFLNDNL